MKKIFTYTASLFFAALTGHFLQAQSFIQNKENKALSFKELQRQFQQFKGSGDLNNLKHWKHFKRYEADMQLHTNAQGEPDGFDVYVEEAVKAAEAKSAATSTTAPWYPVGPSAVPVNLTNYMENGIGRVNCVAFHPTNNSIFYVGVAQGGIWKTTNGGNSYTPLTDNLPITRVSDICLDPNNPNTIYASICDFAYIDKGLFLDGRKRHTHYGLGVYKSTDAGQSWTATGLTYQLTQGDASLIKKIVVNPGNSSELLACGVSGMYRSTNGGMSWTKKLDSLFWDMVQDPVNPSVIYAASGWIKNANIGHAGIYKSSDFGNSWTLLNTGITQQGVVQRIKLAIAPGDNNYIYALCCDNTAGFYGIFKSTNAGSTWTYYLPQLNILEHGQGQGVGGQGPYDLALIVSASDKNTIFTGGINIWGSTDGGINFDPASHWTHQFGTNTVHADIHAIERQPGTGTIFVCCDGGIYKTSNLQTGTWSSSWPTNWTNISNGMQCTSFYRLSSSKNNAGRLIAGAQDNASFYYNGSSWSTVFGGDGMDNYLDPLNNQVVVGSSQFGNFYYSNNNGNSGNFVSSNPNNEDAEWVTPIAADYNHPGVLYIGNENVVKSVNGGQTWTSLGTIYSNTVSQTNTEISALAVSPTNSQVIWAARRVRYELNRKGFVFRSTNGGASFTKALGNLPDSLFYTGIEASPSNSNEAVVCMAGFSAGNKVFKTTDGGLSWINISYNLPNIPLNCIKYVPNSPKLIVATDLGLYILENANTGWVSYSSGLPNVIISDIEFNPALNKVYVSTFGRGVWASNLNQLTTGVEERSVNITPEFSIFPAVNNGVFKLKRSPGLPASQLDVIDVQGRLVHQLEISREETEIRLSVAPGAYYLRLTENDRSGVKKILVE